MKKYAFILASIFVSYSSFSQDGPLTVYFQDSSFSVEAGKSFTNFLVIENAGQQAVTIGQITPLSSYPGLLLYPEAGVSVAPRSVKKFPVKFLTTLELLKGSDSVLGFSLQYHHQGKLRELTPRFKINKQEDMQVFITSNALVQYFDPNIGEHEIQLFLENRAYSKRSLQLAFQSNLAGLDVRTASQEVQLEPKERKQVSVKFGFGRKQSAYPDYQLIVKVIDLLNNESAGSTSIQIVALTSSRQMVPYSGGYSDRNTMELAFSQFDRYGQMLQLKGNADFNLGKQLLGQLHSTFDYYVDRRAVNLYDTWLEIQNKQLGMRLGNLYGYEYDYTIGGRGMMAKWQANDHSGLEVLAVEENYNIYSDAFGQRSGSKIAAVKFSSQKEATKHQKVSYVFEHNPLLQTNSQLIHATSPFEMGRTHRFHLQAGASVENSLQTREAAAGGKLGLNYESNVKDWEFQSYNSLSTGYYAGSTRGSVVLNEQISYRLSPSKRLFIRIENSEVKPKYVASAGHSPAPPDSSFYRQYHYSQQKAKTGFRLNYRGTTYTLSPQIVKQKYFENFFDGKFLSYRFQTDISHYRQQRGLNVLLEYAYSKAEMTEDWFSSFKTNASYRYNDFSVYGTFKFNPQDIHDLRYFTGENKNFKDYGLNVSYSLNPAQKNIKGSFAAGINHSELYQTTNQNLQAHIEYNFSRSWSATGSASYSHYQTGGKNAYSGQNTQFRFGVKRRFGGASIPGYYKVNLLLFDDKNGNGVMDDNESPLASERVELNSQIAITDKKGKVNFQNVPRGIYELKVGESRLTIEGEKNISVEGNKNLKIGLLKYYKVAGSLKEIQQAYDLEAANITGVVVYARDSAGNVTSTLVDQNNRFEFFLIKGNYEIFIENMTYDFLQRSQKAVAGEESGQDLLFEYRKKNKEIKIKKF